MIGALAVTLLDILTALFFYLVIGAYIAFLLSSAWQFSQGSQAGRTLRGINLSLVPLAILLALLGVAAASFNAFLNQAGSPSTPWAIVMVTIGLGGASLALGVEGLILRRRTGDRTAERRAMGYLSLSLIATTVPLVLLGALFLAFATCRVACL